MAATSAPDLLHVAAVVTFVLCFAVAKVSPSCPSGWTVNPGKTKCFMHVANSLPWNKSEEFCQEYKGHLAALTSTEDLHFAQSLCGNNEKGCWVGGRGVNTGIGYRWRWSDNMSLWNESFFPGKPFLFNCTGASCLNADPTDSCTVVTNASVPLVGERCSTSHEFLCMLNKENRCSYKRCHREYLIILAAVSGIILFTILAVVVWLLIFKQSKRRRKSRKLSSASSSALVPPPWKVYTTEELSMITKNFSEGNRLLGDAKTGGTYSGIFPDGTKVAIKRLRRSNFQRKKEFYSEVGRVAKLHHPNLVAVKGCCFDHGSRYIVFEFVANGPLDKWLHHMPRGGRTLDWQMRMKIATTLAQGIAFLHDKVKPHVVHRDVRACNVLLDEDFGAHLMGVGLSKFVSWEVMHERTVTAATYGYLAPEFIYRNELTTKSDVYSFGVLLLEIISSRRPMRAAESVGRQSIFEWATPLIQSRSYFELLDPAISDVPEAGVIQKVADLVYACTEHVPSVRPRMSHVVHQLQQIGLKAAPELQCSRGASPILPLEVETGDSLRSTAVLRVVV